ncbi:hypothetical protein A1O1_03736 [Capronia coronata CBS 617.96]|uniref:Uncharacterized protein n=1 Tax=Capronia coronata CBS 617.96 TaxID=1182541 RepID=W9YDL5_9EURO|nr:uncharacterized protein A1O1_03736 [Capronia coronata CBS 617.96]EXJ90633.1 hypothetical protein A1O1_03736 [Capronia coronata CBS 617.96]
MLSERKGTVNYAIDLLRAHQLRRENLFLHEELKRCCKEIAGLREEVKGATAAVQASHDASEQTRCIVEDHNTRLSDQGRTVETLQQACRIAQSEVSRFQAVYDQTREETQARLELLNRDIDAARADCVRLADIQQKQEEEVLAALGKLQRNVDGKADVSTVDALAVRIDELSVLPPATGHSLPSVSRVQDSFEHRQCAEAGDIAVQVRDSQNRQRPQREEVPREQHQRPPQQQGREETLPDDLDLDENANSFSYAGHRVTVPEETETLRLLRPPDVQASQLARVNLLRQRKNDDWQSYYSEGLALVKALPHAFEETIVRNFANGIFHDVQRRQCQHWLDEKGWTWDNIALFGELCSQLATSTETAEMLDLDDAIRASKKLKETLCAVGRLKAQSKATKSQKTKASGSKARTCAGPLRRSQRQVEEENPSQTQPTQLPADPGPPVAPGPRIRKPRGATSAAKPEIGSELVQDQRIVQQDSPSGLPDPLQLAPRCAEGRLEGGLAGARQVTNRELAQRLNMTPEADCDTREEVPPSPIIVRGIPLKPVASELRPRMETSVPPIPQMVPHKRRIVEATEDSSNDEGFLRELEPRRSKHPVHRTSDGKQKKHKRRRLPLPPPPEIPILSTTSEE